MGERRLLVGLMWSAKVKLLRVQDVVQEEEEAKKMEAKEE